MSEVVVKPTLSVIEQGDGFQIRFDVHVDRLWDSYCREVAFLRKADGWTRQTAEDVPRLAERIRAMESELTRIKR